MSFDKIEIKTSACDHNMASWHYEKSYSVIQSLGYIVDQLKELDVSEELMPDIRHALFDATKLLSFSCGADWSVSDPDLVSKNGSAGIEDLLVKYGVIDETAKQKEKRILQHSISEILKLLENKKPSESRTLIHEYLAKVQSDDEQ